jgi:ribosomal protein S18 acetylase RimI-like enzyme
MPEGVRIRAASDDDVARLARWACAMAWETEHKRLDPARVESGVATVLAEPGRGRYLLACRDDEPVGTLMLTYEWSDWRCADWWWIQSVYVVPGHRRQGVYRALYRHVHEQAAASERVCGLRLYVEKENAAAQATYASLGMGDAGYLMYEQPLPR